MIAVARFFNTLVAIVSMISCVYFLWVVRRIRDQRPVDARRLMMIAAGVMALALFNLALGFWR